MLSVRDVNGGKAPALAKTGRRPVKLTLREDECDGDQAVSCSLWHWKKHVLEVLDEAPLEQFALTGGPVYLHLSDSPFLVNDQGTDGFPLDLGARC